MTYCFKPMRRTYTIKLEIDVVQDTADLCEEEIQTIIDKIDDEVGVRAEIVNEVEDQG